MKKTILIIDDDDMLRASLAKGLRANNFNVITAASSEDAWQVLGRVSSDAIVLDRMMTGLDGLGFLRKIRESGNKIPVIMLTAMSGAENAIAGLSGGADDYLAKPFQLKELVLRLENMLRSPVYGTARENTLLPDGLAFSADEFYIMKKARDRKQETKLLSLSVAEKELLKALVSPVGATVTAPPMVAKRLREKLATILPHLGLIAVRGKGYKIVISDL